MSITTLLLGRPLANREAEGRKIGLFAALPALGLDGLASAAYGPEAMLAVLVVAGAAGPGVVLPITWAILALLAICACPTGKPLLPTRAMAAATLLRVRIWAPRLACSPRRR